MARFAESFFYTFISVQFCVLTFLTPAYAGGAIAEEKERRTLEFVLATDLRQREVILGKIASRLASLGLMLLAGLPILSLLQFRGGVDPGLVLAGFSATAVTMFSLAAVSVYFSLAYRKARNAILSTYLIAGGYLLLTGVGRVLLMIPLIMNWLGGVSDWLPWLFEVVLDALCAGNVFVVLGQLSMGVAGGASVSGVLGPFLQGYLQFHGLVGLGLAGWSTFRLRARGHLGALGHRRGAPASGDGERPPGPGTTRCLPTAAATGFGRQAPPFLEQPHGFRVSRSPRPQQRGAPPRWRLACPSSRGRLVPARWRRNSGSTSSGSGLTTAGAVPPKVLPEFLRPFFSRRTLPG